MAENTNIEWTDHTFNPWEGCTKVGPGCDHCYAEVRNARYAGGESINWGAGVPRRRTNESNWNLPRKWNKNAEQFNAEHGRRQRVFCASLADVFDNEVDPAWRADLFSLIEATPNLDWLLLTKRIGNASKMIKEARLALHGSTRLVHPEVLPNVWFGATVVNQEEADRDISKLLEIRAAVRFLSIEPMLGRIDLCETFGMWWNQTMQCFESHRSVGFNRHPHNEAESAISWVIVGGESGAGARPMNPNWVISLRDQCAAAGVPFLFKQWGEFKPAENNPDGSITLVVPAEAKVSKNFLWVQFDDIHMAKVGKKAAGRTVDGRTHDGFPVVNHG